MGLDSGNCKKLRETHEKVGREDPHDGGEDAPHGGGENPHREVEKRHTEVEITHTGRWRRPHGGGGQTHTEVGENEKPTQRWERKIYNLFQNLFHDVCLLFVM